MIGHIGPVFNTQPQGGVTLIRYSGGFYDYDNGGVWVPGTETPTPVARVNIQPASPRTMEYMAQLGGTQNPRDVRQVWINDGTSLFPADTGRESDFLEFNDELETHRWRVMASDNRPWHNYCKAIIERVRDDA